MKHWLRRADTPSKERASRQRNFLPENGVDSQVKERLPSEAGSDLQHDSGDSHLASKTGESMTQKNIVEEVKRALAAAQYDGVRLDLSEEAIGDIVSTFKENEVALRFLATV
jgi:hypothetical protein